MNNQDLIQTFREQGLLPHQAHFVASFFTNNAVRVNVLNSPPGFGKSTAIAAICSHAVMKAGAKRVLVLTPRAVREQYYSTITARIDKNSVFMVDRRYFRELTSRSKLNSSIWPLPSIVVMSIDFAKQEDVLESLMADDWDIVIVDEGDSLSAGTQRRQLVQSLANHSSQTRMLLVGVRFGFTDVNEYLAGLSDKSGAVAHTDWGPNEIRDWGGQSLASKVKVSILGHSRCQDEIEFHLQFRRELNDTTEFQGRNAVVAASLVRRSCSSLFALEQSLRRLLSQSNEKHSGISKQERYDTGDGELPEHDDIEIQCHDQALAASPTLLSRCANLIDQVSSDGKLDTLIAYLMQTNLLSEVPRERICIVSQYADTVTYLHSAISEKTPWVHAITERNTSLDQQEVLSRFSQDRGILLVTYSVLQRLTLRDISRIVHYDLPASMLKFESHERRLMGGVKDSGLQMIFLEDITGVASDDNMLIRCISKEREC
jgi:hypothetical protein